MSSFSERHGTDSEQLPLKYAPSYGWVRKYSFVSRTTTLDSANSAMMFGIAIAPVKISLIVQMADTDIYAPTNISITYIMR